MGEEAFFKKKASSPTPLSSKKLQQEYLLFYTLRSTDKNFGRARFLFAGIGNIVCSFCKINEIFYIDIYKTENL